MIPVRIAGPDVHELHSQESGRRFQAILRKDLVFIPFEPSPEDLRLLAQNGMVWIVARATPYLPEMTLQVGSQSQVVPNLSREEREREKILQAAGERLAQERRKTDPLARWIERAIYAIAVLIVLGGLALFVRGVFF